MKSVKLQLLVTFVAAAMAVALLSAKGLPPTTSLQTAVVQEDLEQVRRNLAWVPERATRKLDESGRTPLHLAASRHVCHAEVMVGLFLDAGIDPNVRDDCGRTPLHYAAQGRSAGPLGSLILARDGTDGLKESFRVAKLLVTRRASVGAEDDFGGTPLHDAAECGEPETVGLLLANGARVNRQDAADRTPLHYGAAGGDVAVVELLLADDGDVNAKDIWGKTPLALAVEGRHRDVAALLRRRGARE